MIDRSKANVKPLIQHLKRGDIRLYEAINHLGDVVNNNAANPPGSTPGSGSSQGFSILQMTLRATITMVSTGIDKPADGQVFLVEITQGVGNQSIVWADEFEDQLTTNISPFQGQKTRFTFIFYEERWRLISYYVSL